MRLLIFGGSGFVGSNIVYYALEGGCEVIIADKDKPEFITKAEWLPVELSDYESVKKVFIKAEPDVVVNVAAIADIDYAEKHKELASKINTDGAAYIARICKKFKSKYIFFSSDAVFDGRGESYSESDQVNPINYYGQTKALAEKLIRSENPESIIVRISLVLGFPLATGNSFVKSLKTKLQNHEKLKVPADIIRTPIDVHTLSKVILELSEKDFKGIINIGCTEKADRYLLTKKLAEALGYSQDNIEPVLSNEDETGKAHRHKNGILDVSKANQILNIKMLSLDQTIQNAVKQIEIQ